jgi:hypothetical protein
MQNMSQINGPSYWIRNSSILILALVAYAALHDDVRLAPGYEDLTGCQQYCIAGLLSWDVATDYSSWVSDSPCRTQVCLCRPESQLATESYISECRASYTRACALDTTEYNGAIIWVAGYCGWTPNLVTPTTTVSHKLNYVPI